MAITTADADAYISANCIDVEDWTDSDTERKTRLLNVASRTLNKKFSTLTIPDGAVYEFANVLSIRFNDTNKQAQSGVKSFAISGISFTFGNVETDLVKMIPQSSLDIIGVENDTTLRVRRIGRGVL